MTTTTYGLQPCPIPHWASYHVVIGAPDGYHHKFYQGWPNAQREFRSQLGWSKDPKNYFAEIVGDDNQAVADWTLEKELERRGYFEVVDDWGRTICIERVNTDR